MDIVSRLKFFLQHSGISNSTFADTCEIPRPTLSQLLNGRNKKVSDEIITKIHTAYPRLNIMWLMFADGDMFVPNANSQENNVAPQLDENSLFSETHSTPCENQGGNQTSISFGDEESNYAPVNAQKPASVTLPEMLQTMVSGQVKQAPKGAKQAGPRQVESIIVFYNDNSFETFTRR